MEDYRTIHGTATGEYEEKKSRFIAALSFADSEEAAVAFLEQVRAANRTARHNVYAYRLREGNRERYSDDGTLAVCCWAPAAWCVHTPRLRPVHWKMPRWSRCAAWWS